MGRGPGKVKLTTKQAKDLICEFEAAQSGIEKLADQGVGVVNVRITNEHITADVIFADYTDNTTERHNDLFYPIKALEEFHKTRVISKELTRGRK